MSFKRTPRYTFVLAVFAVAALSACGGGGGDDDKATPVTVTVADLAPVYAVATTFSASGTSVSEPNAMASAGWSVAKLTAGSPDLTVVNGDCAVATKSSRTVNGLTRSNWSCGATITTPAAMPAAAVYRLTYTSVDDKGNASSDFRDITVSAGAGSVIPSVGPTATSQAAVSVLSGDDVNLNCVPAGGSLAADSDYRIQWVVKTNASGLPISSAVSTDGTTLSFKAPFVRSVQSVTFQCRVTDDNLATGISDSVVTINPGSTVAAVANAGPTQTVTSGAVVSLDGAGSAAEGNPFLYYTWTQTSGPAVALTSASTATPGFIAPNVASTTALTFQLIAQVSPGATANAAPSEIATTSVFVSPDPQMSLIITGAQSAVAGSPVSLTVSVSPSFGSYFYEWTQVSGPAVTLGGANTATASFIAPSGGVADMRFSVRVARTPVATASVNDIVSSDVVVRVQ